MRRFAFRHTLLALVAAGGIACGASSGSSVVPSGGTSAPSPARSDRNLITLEDLRDARETNLYDVVLRLRPDWLRSRGPTSFNAGTSSQGSDAVNLYQDLQRLGTVDMLKSMSISSATSLRYYSASDAQMRFGVGNPNGAVQLIIRP